MICKDKIAACLLIIPEVWYYFTFLTDIYYKELSAWKRYMTMISKQFSSDWVDSWLSPPPHYTVDGSPGVPWTRQICTFHHRGKLGSISHQLTFLFLLWFFQYFETFWCPRWRAMWKDGYANVATLGVYHLFLAENKTKSYYAELI